MNQLFAKRALRAVMVSTALIAASMADAQSIHITTFATGTGVNATQPDSISVGENSLWVSYANGADSTGAGGSSTVVQYRLKDGSVRSTYSIAGSVDGLKIAPSGLVWAMQNQDGNSTLSLIDPEERTVSAPIPYAVPSATRGYDDVAFRVHQTFVSYTNPTGPADATIQLVKRDSNPLVLTTILLAGATGTDLATGLPDQPTTQNDPDSLKLTPYGDLMLSSGDDGQLIFVSQPGTAKQSVSFLTLLDPATKQHVSGLDDAVFVTARKGTFFLADTGNNRILKIDAQGLPVGALYASVSSVKALVSVDLKTGVVTPVIGNLNGPHGLQFVAHTEADD